VLRLCAFDVETQGRSPEFVCGSIFSDSTVAYYTNPTEMVETLRAHARKGFKFIAHNAEYDIATLLWANGEDVSIRYANNQYMTAAWRYGNGQKTATVWDNMRLCAGLSLEALGEAIGIPKYPMPRRLKDGEDIRQDWVCQTHSNPGCYECYCTRDAEIVWSYANALSEWLGAYGLSLHYSLARSAIDLWRLLDPDKQQSIHSHELRRFARESNYGGRCEPFTYGNVGRVYTSDFRSCYGSILHRIELPDMPSLRLSSGDMGILSADTCYGVCRATVSIDAQYIPPLPVRYADRTYYPVGRCTGVWTLAELRTAMAHGVTVESVGQSYHTETTVRPFATVADVLLTRRESLRNSHDSRELACKYLMNAIPGRLAMRDATEIVSYRRWRQGDNGHTANGADIERVGRDVFLARRSTLTRPSMTSNVLWAAHILSEARAKLYRQLVIHGEHALYCDTDSIHSSRPIDCGPDLPGELRDTGVFDTGIYLGAKFYSLETFDGKSDARAKGIPRTYAVEFIKNRHISYQTALGVADGILRGVSPAIWVDVDRVARYAPGTRMIVEPGVLTGEVARSITAPVVFGQLEADGPNVSVHGIL
jgi:hypothetical protein